MLITTQGTLIRLDVDAISRQSRSAQGVVLMRANAGNTVAALASIATVEEPESSEPT